MIFEQGGNSAAGHRRRQPRLTSARGRVGRRPDGPDDGSGLPLAALALLLALGLAPATAAAQPPRDLFTTAQAKEREARSAMVAPRTTAAAVQRTIRAAVSAYEKAAARDASGGYADAALWSAAELAGDAFGAFGAERDRQTALRLAQAVLRQHPDSVYGPKATELMSRISSLRFGEPVAIAGIEQRVGPEGTEIVVDLARGAWYRAVRLEQPPRLYIDLYNTRVPDALRGAVVSYDSGVVAQLRLGHHPHDTTRVVLEGNDVHGCAPAMASGPARLVVFCRAPAPAAPPPPELPAPRPFPALVPDEWQPTLPPLASVRGPLDPVVLHSPPANAELPYAVRPAAAATAIDHESEAPAPRALARAPENDGGGTRDTRGPVSPDMAGIPATGLSTSSAECGTPSGVEREGTPLSTGADASAPMGTPMMASLALVVDAVPPAPVDGEAAGASSTRVAHAPPLASRPVTRYANLAPAVPSPLLAAPPGRTPTSPMPPPPLLFAQPAVPALSATRPTVQVTGAAQVLSGGALRYAGLQRVQPDLGVQLALPRSRVGRLYADVNVTTRAGQPVVGRSVVRLSGFRAMGLTWDADAGDTLAAPVTPDFGFSNLFAPPLNLRGAYVAGRSERTSITASAAQVMARRNIFGTDTLSTGQQLVQIAVSHRPDRFLEIFGQATDVRGNSPSANVALVDASTEAGGGFRYRPASSWELIADVGYSTFRRTGSTETERDVSALLGATWTGPKGWLQLNASRRALGHFAVGSYPYNDRSSVFASGEWWPHERLRLYGGADLARTGLTPSAADDALVSLPAGTSTRAFGGARLRVGSWSTVGLRLEGGGRDVSASKFSGGFTTNSGALSADWNVRVGSANALVRYERRSDVDAGADGSHFTQQDGSAQLFVSLGPSQLFLQGLLSQQSDRGGPGQTLWQASGGGQVPLGRLYTRFEGAWGFTRDWVTGRVVRRQSLSASASGSVTDGTRFSIDVYLDHTPIDLRAASPWALRTMVRVTQALSFGASRSNRASGPGVYRGPTGKVTGVVFADWNGNGVVDLDEEPVPGVRVVAGSAWVTGDDKGRFVLAGVPTGDQMVALDLASIPASFDPPAEMGATVRISSRNAASLDFGLVPLGSIHGIVFQDVDGDGVLTPPDAALDRAVVVLDDGERTELTREGRFWFDNVHIGTHTVSLLLPSLPDGAQLAGPATQELTLGREEPASQVVFVITMEKRQEIRKVFTPKKRN